MVKDRACVGYCVGNEGHWRSRYGRGRVVMIVTAIAATMVGRMARKEDEVLGAWVTGRYWRVPRFFFSQNKKI